MAEPLDPPIFVRVDLILGSADGDRRRLWGLHSVALRDILPIYTDDWEAVDAELGDGRQYSGLTDNEVETVVVAENDPDTPDAAWAALAEYRLTH